MTQIAPGFVAQLKKFERDLDDRLAACAVYSMDADEALALLVRASEFLAQRGTGGNSADKAIDVFAPYLVSGAAGEPANLEQLLDDLNFGGDYYLLREYLYYAFNVPGSFDWTVTGDRTDIRFADRSIPRQFYASWNEAVVGSRYHFRDKSTSDTLAARIRGLSEWESIDDDLGALLESEADHKLSAYFAILPPDSAIDLGGYTYAQFHSFYRLLVSKALWHRYHAKVNDEGGALHVDEAELIGAAHQDLGIPQDVLALILNDLVYDAAAAADRLSPSSFSLLREGRGGRIWVRPIHFCTHEGIIGVLRVVAQRRPQHFLRYVSGALGAGLVARMDSAFTAQGFRCVREINLTRYDPALPDIDLLVISHEPTLGFVILVCEVKSPIPANWAKDHLRVLNTDSVSKAFGQCERVGQFLTSQDGLSVLRSWLPNEGLGDFDHFLVVLQPLVITSQNAGMFFDAMRTPVFAYNTIERMLRASDGDIAYVQHMLKVYHSTFDENAAIARRHTKLARSEVDFDTVDVQAIIEFPPNRWLSDGTRDRVIAEFVQDGYQPGDTFTELWRHALAMAQGEKPANGAGAERGPRKTVILFDGNPERRGILVVDGTATNEAED